MQYVWQATDVQEGIRLLFEDSLLAEINADPEQLGIKTRFAINVSGSNHPLIYLGREEISTMLNVMVAQPISY